VEHKPETILLEGAELLKPLFEQHHFIFEPLGTGNSSGGSFAFAAFRRADRKFEFHFRYSLGMVAYHLGPESISHEEYMCSVLGRSGLSRYPNFSHTPMEAFRALLEDLQRYGNDFLNGSDEAFQDRIRDGRLRWRNRPKLPE
jgi:hypothetical protein